MANLVRECEMLAALQSRVGVRVETLFDADPSVFEPDRTMQGCAPLFPWREYSSNRPQMSYCWTSLMHTCTRLNKP